jgi:hypothetical protein
MPILGEKLIDRLACSGKSIMLSVLVRPVGVKDEKSEHWKCEDDEQSLEDF